MPAPRAEGRRGPSRPHINEVDPLRVVTALVVVAVHVLAFVNPRGQSELGARIQSAALVATHFTRAVFMFVTAFTLVYVYYCQPFPFKRFWRRRGAGVLVPYGLWSVAYAWFNTPRSSALGFGKVVVLDLLTGAASYQLYYILLTLQFYLLLPLFLRFLRRVERWPWRTLGGCFLLQWLLLYTDYHFLQTGAMPASGWFHALVQFRERFVLTYPFYFVLGGLAARYFPRVRAAVRRYGRWSLVGFAVALAAAWGHFAFQVGVERQALGYAMSVLQPVMLFYSVATIAVLGWLACVWARRVDHTGQPVGYRLWKRLSDASFGVYLIHAAVLTVVARWVVPVLPLAWPGALIVFVAWLLTATGAMALSVALVHLPLASRLVGRDRPLPRGLSPRHWLAPWLARLTTAKS